MGTVTKDFKPIKPAKALIIGHDPTLHNTDTQAEYAFFANYYFKEEPKRKSEIRKYMLAKKTFDQIRDITGGKIGADEIYITNLCNKPLAHSDGVVRIPQKEAIEGVKRIREILKDNPTIKHVFSMSLQVNYWLQELGFYSSCDSFLIDTRPRTNNETHAFKPRKGRSFLYICGKQFNVIGHENVIVIPILHTKQYPLSGRMIVYEDSYRQIREYFKTNQ